MTRIFLSGPPGVGKTTVARCLAERMGRPFVDTDALVAEQLRSPADVLRTAGEATLRRAELEALRDLPRDAVVSLGGGTTTSSEARARIRRSGLIVGLQASNETLWARLSKEGGRPLASDAESLRALVESRRAIYAVRDAEFSCELEPETVATRIESWLEAHDLLEARVSEARSRVVVGQSLPVALAGALRALAPSRPILLLEDEGVPQPWRDAFVRAAESVGRVFRRALPGGEAVKTWRVLGDVLEEAIGAGCGRQSVVVGLGGGALCDLSGCVAGLLGRGAPLVLVPSTLLAQVDASVGGKCAVNASHGKNLLGLFHPATDVLVDLELLTSLPEEELRSGAAELFKMAVLAGGPLWARLSDPRAPRFGVDPQTVALAIQAKADIVASDPFEHGRRKVLNLGHTLAHALERASDYGLRHGDAVALGTASVVRWSRWRGTMSDEVAREILDVQARLGLPDRVKLSELKAALPHFGRDKKGHGRGGHEIALSKTGAPELVEVQWQELGRELEVAETEG